MSRHVQHEDDVNIPHVAFAWPDVGPEVLGSGKTWFVGNPAHENRHSKEHKV